MNDDGPQVITVLETTTKKGKKKKGAKAGSGGKTEGPKTLDPRTGSYRNPVEFSLLYSSF